MVIDFYQIFADLILKKSTSILCTYYLCTHRYIYACGPNERPLQLINVHVGAKGIKKALTILIKLAYRSCFVQI